MGGGGGGGEGHLERGLDRLTGWKEVSILAFLGALLTTSPISDESSSLFLTRGEGLSSLVGLGLTLLSPKLANLSLTLSALVAFVGLTLSSLGEGPYLVYLSSFRLKLTTMAAGGVFSMDMGTDVLFRSVTENDLVEPGVNTVGLSTSCFVTTLANFSNCFLRDVKRCFCSRITSDKPSVTTGASSMASLSGETLGIGNSGSSWSESDSSLSSESSDDSISGDFAFSSSISGMTGLEASSSSESGECVISSFGAGGSSITSEDGVGGVSGEDGCSSDATSSLSTVGVVSMVMS